jgi:hypothetical protein
MVGKRLAAVTLVLAALMIAAAAPAAGWSDPVRVSPLALDGDPDGPAIASHAGKLYIAVAAQDEGIFLFTNRTGTWRRQRVSSGIDTQPSIAVDRDGHVHIAFARLDGSDCGDICQDDLVYASDRSGAWTERRIAGGANYLPSIGLDHAGLPWIAYLHRDAGDHAHDDWQIVLAHRFDGHWGRMAIQSELSFGDWPRPNGPSLATSFDGVDDHVFVAYRAHTEADSAIRLFEQVGGDMAIRRTVTSHDSAAAPAVAVDGQGVPYVAYVESPAQLWVAAKPDGARWQRERISTHALSEARPSVDAWGHGKVAVVIEQDRDRVSDGSGRILFRTNASGSWEGSLITDGPGDHLPAIVVLRSGDARVAFLRGVHDHQLWLTRSD